MTDHNRPSPLPAQGPASRQIEPTLVVPETQAKQGRKGTHVITVLIVSLILIIIAAGLLFTWQQTSLQDNASRGTAPAFTQPPAANTLSPPAQTGPSTR